jgi:hypothetical protein
MVNNIGAVMAADEDLELLVTFNGSATFNLYAKAAGCKDDCWEAVDIRTIYHDDGATMRQGFDEAEEWLSEIRKENEEGF